MRWRVLKLFPVCQEKPANHLVDEAINRKLLIGLLALGVAMIMVGLVIVFVGLP